MNEEVSIIDGDNQEPESKKESKKSKKNHNQAVEVVMINEEEDTDTHTKKKKKKRKIHEEEVLETIEPPKKKKKHRREKVLSEEGDQVQEIEVKPIDVTVTDIKRPKRHTKVELEDSSPVMITQMKEFSSEYDSRQSMNNNRQSHTVNHETIRTQSDISSNIERDEKVKVFVRVRPIMRNELG